MQSAKFFFLLSLILFFGMDLTAQEFYQINEGETQKIGNFEVSYKANFKRNKKGYDQYEVRVSVKNTGNRVLTILSEAGTYGEQYGLVYVKFLNARRGLLRNTEGAVHADAYKTSFSYSYPNCDYDPNDKDSQKYIYKTVSKVVGYGIRQGQTISGTIDMSVLEGEKVQLEMALNDAYHLDL